MLRVKRKKEKEKEKEKKLTGCIGINTWRLGEWSFSVGLRVLVAVSVIDVGAGGELHQQ